MKNLQNIPIGPPLDRQLCRLLRTPTLRPYSTDLAASDELIEILSTTHSVRERLVDGLWDVVVFDKPGEHVRVQVRRERRPESRARAALAILLTKVGNRYVNVPARRRR